MENCLATDTKKWKGNGVKENFRLAKEVQLKPGEGIIYCQTKRRMHNLHYYWQQKNYILKLLEKIWFLAKEKGNPEEINSKLLLARSKYGETALHIAAEGSVALLEKLNEDELKINSY